MFDNGVLEPHYSRDEIDVIELRRQEPYRFIVMDVALDRFFRVINLFADCRNKISFEVERDDLTLVRLS